MINTIDESVVVKEEPSKTSTERYYLGCWSAQIAEGLNVLTCAWREQGLWTVRSRFRYLTCPRREARYEAQKGRATNAVMLCNIGGLMKAANPSEASVTAYCIEGGPEKLMQVLLSKGQLYDLAWDDATLPILEKSAADSIAENHTLRINSHPKRRAQNWRDLVRDVATNARLVDWNPRAISFWTLDLTAMMASEDVRQTREWESINQAIRKGRRKAAQWLRENAKSWPGHPTCH